MKIKNLKIGVQLMLGFAAMLIFVVTLGVVSYEQSGKIADQGEIMNDHPLKVRRAIGALEADILNMRLATRDLMLAKTEIERQDAIQLTELAAADAHLQFGVLKTQYLGPTSDVDAAYNAFVSWKTAREENTKLALSGEIEKVKASILPLGTVGNYREQMLAKIKVIDNFARQKTDELFAKSQELNNQLNRQLILIVLSILLLSGLTIVILLRNIRKPLNELTEATHRFQHGDLNARCSYQSKNEFGVLSDSFNTLADTIQKKLNLDEKVTNLAALMASEYDVKKFFQTTINALAAHTGSQIAAIYLLSSDKRSFNHFESIGIDDNARQSFAANHFEGEFGAVLSSRKVQHIKSIPEDTRFLFHTVSCKLTPREIITLPILANNEVVAIISLASVNAYSQLAIQLIDRIHVTLCARVEGILAFHQLKDFSKRLEQQNSELETQKSELSAQSAELTEQNTELELQAKQLDQANQLKSTFLSNMSHELRTPLNSVIALSGVLHRKLKNQIPDDEYSYLEVIERNGKHLLELINDILDISRIEAGREEIEITKFNVCQLVDDVASMIKPQADKKNIQLLNVSGDCKVSINSDVNKFRHIIQNLIGNAVKFTDEGTVEIIVNQLENNINIVVTDSGIGISEKHQMQIFDEFRQADGSTSRKYGGTGLGLAIAKKYANLLGGTITVKSTPGVGSEFTLSLPLQYDHGNKISPADTHSYFKTENQQIQAKHSLGGSEKTILIVDDSEPAIIQLKDILAEIGYQILVANKGDDALEIIRNIIPDAMILDLMMPGIDGFEVLKTLRNAESTAAIPVLVLTAKHITKDELRFLKHNNVHQLIQKGDVNRAELLQAVAKMVILPIEELPKTERKIQKFHGKPVVLVVEDNADNMITLKAILGDNYTIFEAIDGREAVAMAKKYLPNLILMDIALPNMDGIEAFKLMRNDPNLQHIPIVALTASAMTTDRETILAYGFDSYIAKPIDEHIFFKTINETLYGN
ncbi:MAG: response regulator [Prolixibacteraceae bacterium]|nr:response regulator [Prolixibacteraceae bacterium]